MDQILNTETDEAEAKGGVMSNDVDQIQEQDGDEWQLAARRWTTQMTT